LTTAKAHARLGNSRDSIQCAERAKRLAVAFGQADMVHLIEREMQRQ
jgi:hypothetical protein